MLIILKTIVGYNKSQFDEICLDSNRFDQEVIILNKVYKYFFLVVSVED